MPKIIRIKIAWQKIFGIALSLFGIMAVLYILFWVGLTWYDKDNSKERAYSYIEAFKAGYKSNIEKVDEK